MTRSLVLMDVSNLYHCMKKKFGGRLDYQKFLEHLTCSGLVIYRAIAYGSQLAGEAEGFITFLKRNGYEVRFKQVKQYPDGTHKANLDIEIAMDAVKILESVDVVVLGSADGDFASLIDYIQSRGKRCFVYGSDISSELKQIADEYYEFAPEHLVGDGDAASNIPA